MGNQESAHKELTCKLIFSKSQGRSNSLKNTDSIREEIHWLIWGHLPEGRGLVELSLEIKTLTDVIFFFLSFPWVTCCQQVSFLLLFFNLTKTVSLAQMFQRTSPDQSTCPHWPLQCFSLCPHRGWPEPAPAHLQCGSHSRELASIPVCLQQFQLGPTASCGRTSPTHTSVCL